MELLTFQKTDSLAPLCSTLEMDLPTSMKQLLLVSLCNRISHVNCCPFFFGSDFIILPGFIDFSAEEVVSLQVI